jgi:hypothetical protein
MDSLSLTATRVRDRRAALARAGTRIVGADPRYMRVDVDRASGEESHRLRAVRREDSADDSCPQSADRGPVVALERSPAWP